MNIITYALRYWLAVANSKYEEAYWDQVKANDIWVGFLKKMIEGKSSS